MTSSLRFFQKRTRASKKRMKTWFRRVRHLTRYVSSILKLISSIISASSRWKASRKKSQKGWDNFQKKKDFKDFQVSMFQDNDSRINFPRWPWWDSRIPRQSGCRGRVPKIQPKRQLIKRNSKSSYTVCYQTTAEPRLEWVCSIIWNYIWIPIEKYIFSRISNGTLSQNEYNNWENHKV